MIKSILILVLLLTGIKAQLNPVFTIFEDTFISTDTPNGGISINNRNSNRTNYYNSFIWNQGVVSPFCSAGDQLLVSLTNHSPLYGVSIRLSSYNFMPTVGNNIYHTTQARLFNSLLTITPTTLSRTIVAIKFSTRNYSFTRTNQLSFPMVVTTVDIGDDNWPEMVWQPGCLIDQIREFSYYPVARTPMYVRVTVNDENVASQTDNMSVALDASINIIQNTFPINPIPVSINNCGEHLSFNRTQAVTNNEIVNNLITWSFTGSGTKYLAIGTVINQPIRLFTNINCFVYLDPLVILPVNTSNLITSIVPNIINFPTDLVVQGLIIKDTNQWYTTTAYSLNSDPIVR